MRGPHDLADLAGQALFDPKEFKALHQLRKDAAPPPHGQPLVIDGATCYLAAGMVMAPWLEKWYHRATTRPRGGKDE